MKNIIVFLITFVITCMFWSVVYAEGTSIQIEEWDDVYVISNGNNTFRIDCVPDEDTTQDIVGFCNVMHSTYYYGPSCDQECILDTRMQSVQ
tara:strand:- start:393 stop:668 length:276 start_codon:yes stop_codon:yes gene_type:complete